MANDRDREAVDPIVEIGASWQGRNSCVCAPTYPRRQTPLLFLNVCSRAHIWHAGADLMVRTPPHKNSSPERRRDGFGEESLSSRLSTFSPVIQQVGDSVGEATDSSKFLP